MRLILIICALSLSACETVKYVDRPYPVEVVKEIPAKVDPSFLLPCDNKPDTLKNGITNGELREIAVGYEGRYVPCLESRLKAINDLYGNP